jgi:hypothetical protein
VKNKKKFGGSAESIHNAAPLQELKFIFNF